ncbi:GFA family protein [Labrys wisconsinensis]|uniref:CENP-V/GFA domain-containing protein n=1 Tax=Labrys wisconsinensis TaxID=425677 RepID=A0ABU0J1L9_9HYPH|nr:GFA family protein [Labrys wisconsinensis]MDQ0468138.1 hypothetical protein [Labrys wisconsinensis]
MSVITGGCLCGDIRYEASAPPRDTGYCHCRMCQRQSGATALPFATFALDCFAYVRGTPQVYVSSDHGERRFCPRCSASLDYRERISPTEVSINAGTLDDPGLAAPRRHIWAESRIAWFATADDLPTSPQD